MDRIEHLFVKVRWVIALRLLKSGISCIPHPDARARLAHEVKWWLEDILRDVPDEHARQAAND